MLARALLSHNIMSFSAVVDRVRSEFVEMPGMQLTLAQATRLWNLGLDDCRAVIDALVDVGFLTWTPRQTVVRTSVVRTSVVRTSTVRAGDGRAVAAYANVSVRRKTRFDNSVG
jgi:hypothetical protein